MKVLHLSWEYPPNIVGGLGRHVYYLTKELAKLGIDVVVITINYGYEEVEEEVNGVNVIRVNPFKIKVLDFISWVHSFNLEMLKRASQLLPRWRPDIIHVHDWLTAPSGVPLKHAAKAPLIATVHATEHGRRGGLRSPESKHIHEWEWLMSFEAWRLIACSNYMRDEVVKVLGAPHNKISVIPNGVAGELLDFKVDWSKRRNYAYDWEKIVVFFGRMVYEKGPDKVLEAFRKLLGRRQDVKLIMIGDGPMYEYLANAARDLGSKVYLAGRLPDEDLYSVVGMADVVTLPSRYEPFGISVLEGMALGRAVIGPNRGGPAEIIQNMVNGITVDPEDSDALANDMDLLLGDEGRRRYIGGNARRTVLDKYRWDLVAKSTAELYAQVVEERKRTVW
ncbi:glycosyl transferase family 1 [Thermocladium modestius]|uniref:Glycosyl transferase family 1 n=1 Tax=Thermocladium modestius TaxID=62609 RepID=A0A830GUH8_9CREN|nr:glycosyltransferase family 4 protein [Thermocladium modestius]GGP20185.1 glycosyl transferase family 1 [Thermocladium modestius]